MATTSSGNILTKSLTRVVPRGKLSWLVAIAVLGGLVAYAATRSDGGSSASTYRTGKIEKRNLEVSISATGTVEPEEVIDVGAQVAGLITSFGTDKNGKSIDYGSVVEEGMILANIDSALYQSDVQQAQAQVERAKADVEQLRAKLVQAELDWKRAQTLGPSDALSKSAFDSYKASFLSAQAAVGVGQAQITQAEAALFKANRSLGYCVIRSPVKGVIIDKRVNVGQTVVSSLNAPSLFLIAKDLTRMQVWISVNEADIGSVHPDQKVSFTVDAFAGEEFFGTVGKIRLNASMTQNVVTYIVEVNTDNSSGRLLPYLTANARFEVGKRENVLTVPASALRWAPSAGTPLSPRPNSTAMKPGEGVVWVLEKDATLRSVAVKVGLTDGISTEVSGENVREGDLVVTGLELPSAGSTSGAAKNPFAPQMPRGGRRL